MYKTVYGVNSAMVGPIFFGVPKFIWTSGGYTFYSEWRLVFYWKTIKSNLQSLILTFINGVEMLNFLKISILEKHSHILRGLNPYFFLFKALNHDNYQWMALMQVKWTPKIFQSEKINIQTFKQSRHCLPANSFVLWIEQ